MLVRSVKIIQLPNCFFKIISCKNGCHKNILNIYVKFCFRLVMQIPFFASSMVYDNKASTFLFIKV